MLKYLSLGAALLLVTPAFAAQTADPVRAECRKTVESLCPGVQPGGGRLRACLKQQGKTLKEVCPQLAAEKRPPNTAQSAPATGGAFTAPQVPQGAGVPTVQPLPSGSGAAPGDSFPPNP